MKDVFEETKMKHVKIFEKRTKTENWYDCGCLNVLIACLVSSSGRRRFQPINTGDRSFDGRYGTFKFNTDSFFVTVLVLELSSAASASSWNTWCLRTSPELSTSSAKLRLILKLAVREIFEERTETMRMSETIDRVSCN